MEPRRHSPSDFQALAEFRYQIRRFLNFSQRAARELGLETQQYQALLALKGMPAGRKETIGALAERLLIQHHSTVELIDRLEKHGLLRRSRGTADRREVFVRLTGQGERLLRRLTTTHRAELRAAGPALLRALESLIWSNSRNASSRSRLLQRRARHRPNR